MSELRTVPSFIFYQNQDGSYENAIEVSYYNGSIQLLQEDHSILITNENYQQLFKDIKKHFERAQQVLNKK